MSKLEYKYLVPNNKVSDVRDFIANYVRLDKYAAKQQKNEYVVRSLYYDTINFNFYHEKIEGIKKRKKVRIRGYNEITDDVNVFLEIKRKNDGAITKTRSTVAYRDLWSLVESGDVDRFIESKNGDDLKRNAQRFLFQIKNLALKPMILISYEREAFYSKFNPDLRITIDKNLRSRIKISNESFLDKTSFVKALPGFSIMEVKTRMSFPSWLNYIIATLELRRQALSKYTICLDSHKKKGFRINRFGLKQEKIEYSDQTEQKVA